MSLTPSVVQAPDPEFVAAAVRLADPNPLRIALYQATGNPALAAMTVRRVAARGGAAIELALSDADQELVRQLAIDFLRDRHAWVAPAPPTHAEQTELVRLLVDRELPGDELAMSVEELAFDEFPRAASWTASRPADRLKDFRVVIIGAGISGITMGIQLGRLGIDYTILERQSGVGGTWQRNRYPDIRVDTPCTGYQFKFVRNFRWSEYFPGRGEVANYLFQVADEYGVTPHVEFGCEVTAATWDEAAREWELVVTGPAAEPESIRANVVVTACGLFNVAKYPDTDGLGLFAGDVIHPATWQEGTDLTGKRVAIIGNGSTGVQLMPRLAEVAQSLTVYQRTPSWIRPSPMYKKSIPDAVNWLLDTMPYYRNWQICSNFVGGDSRLNSEALKYDAEWQAQGGLISEQNDKLRAWLTGYIEEQLSPRPELIPMVVPPYAPHGRRMVVDNGWYAALLRDNVELVAGEVDHFTPTGIVSSDGVERAFDVVVSATGYQVMEYLWPAVFTGRDGVPLSQEWASEGPRAYLGMTVPGFPNMFIMYGPNGQPRAGNFHSWAEVTSRYIAEGLIRLIETASVSIEVKRSAYVDYNQKLDEAFKGIIWSSEGANGYFAVQPGRGSVSMPWEHYEYFRMIRHLDPEDFTITTR